LSKEDVMNIPLVTQNDFRLRRNIGNLLRHQKMETRREWWRHALTIVSMTLFFLFLLIVL